MACRWRRAPEELFRPARRENLPGAAAVRCGSVPPLAPGRARRRFAGRPLSSPKHSGIEIRHLVHIPFDFAQGRLRSFDLWCAQPNHGRSGSSASTDGPEIETVRLVGDPRRSDAVLGLPTKVRATFD